MHSNLRLLYSQVFTTQSYATIMYYLSVGHRYLPKQLLNTSSMCPMLFPEKYCLYRPKSYVRTTESYVPYHILIYCLVIVIMRYR